MTGVQTCALPISLCQVGDVARPIVPQVHNVIPEWPYPSKPKPAAPAIPFLPTPLPHVPFDPYPAPPAPETPARLNPSLVANPIPVNPRPPSTSSESSESAESSESDSSEELGGAAAVRRPSDFRYRPRRGRRQALVTSKPPHTPVFLSLFPAGSSPFRSCPGPPPHLDPHKCILTHTLQLEQKGACVCLCVGWRGVRPACVA